ncbi:hypothetical protein [Sediminibacillus sp. JSM 1682029]|uniref:hypothetical protein n=1 Tax=Sediminibacillus sp. JSM 1682029 TaxID=3229857 RepID=UPI0035268E24
MLDMIEVVINHIDDHFNSEIHRKDIEELADCSFEDFSVEFEKETGMQFLRYLVRRQLTLVKEEISRKNGSIDKKYSPFNGYDEFRTIFEFEFNIKVDEILDNEKIILQDRYGSEEWRKHDLVLKELLDKAGNSTNALRYLLSLPPYYLEGIPSYFYSTYKVEVIDLLIRRTYGELLSTSEYNNVVFELETFYMMGIEYSIKDLIVITNKYVLVNRGLINRLLLDYGAEFEYSVSELRTLWGISYDEKLLFNGEDSQLSHNVLKAIRKMESGSQRFENIDELRSWISVDYSKPKNGLKIQRDLTYPYSLIEDEYEVLETGVLREEINDLLVHGLLYLKPKE